MTHTQGIIALALVAMLGCAQAADAAWRNSLKPAGTRGRGLVLAAGGKTDYVIVIPAKPTTQERKAADDLALWLGEMSSAVFRIVPDSEPAIETEISIGRTKRLGKAYTPAASLGDEGYAIGRKGRTLFLIGGRTRGPINAVYALLEEDLGCRWYAGESARIPHPATLRLNPATRSYVPPLIIRDPFYSDAFNPTWSLRNRTNAPGAAVPEEWGGRMDYDGMFVHTFNRLVPPDQYLKDHPEYYALINGQRNPQQLCLTNPDVLKIATAAVLDMLKTNPNTEIAEVSPNDGGQHCACPNCAAIDNENGSPAGSLITFCNQIGEAVEKEYPRVWISTLAYLDTVDAPTKVRPRRNVMVRLCDDLHSWRYPLIDFVSSTYPESKRYRDAIIAWSKICNTLTIWDYTTNFSHYLAPMPNMNVIKPSVDFYVAHNVKGIMFQGAYQSPGGERMAMRCWVMAKLLWDPTRDVDALTQDFVSGYYEEAAGPIAAYYRLLDDAGRRQPSNIEGGIRYPMDAPFLSREFLDQATGLFDQAMALAGSDEIRRRVELARLPLVYVKLCRGPEFTGAAAYGDLLDEFERVATREKITHLAEGAPDVAAKVAGWREALAKAGQ
jgi:hypothetical protein